ncbi:hypothetical protein KCU77_g5620, partial [Aureobasidium melanogenum]
MLQDLSCSGLHALVVCWRLSHFPAGIPESLKTDAYSDDYLKSKDQEGFQWPFYVQSSKRIENETGLNAILSPGQNAPNYEGREPERGPALELAVKLAERRGVDPLIDPKVNEILATFPGLPIDNLEDGFLVGSQQCATLLMSGALARALGLSDEELDNRAAELLEASRQRYWHGPLSQGPETILELLQSCSEKTVARTDEQWAEMDLEKPISLFRSPASEEHISGLEQRLKVTFPEDFKAFLRVSNGFGGIWFVVPGLPLRPVDEIDWLDCSEYELEFYQLTLPSLDEYDDHTQTNGEGFEEPPIITKVICIASEDVDDVCLIPPQLVQQMRDYYKQLYGMVNNDGKQIIERAVEDFAGSWDEWDELAWGCVSGACRGYDDMQCFKSFKSWLKQSAWNAKYVDD